MDNPESQSTMGPQDIGQKRKQTKNYTTQKTKKINGPLHFAFFHMCFKYVIRCLSSGPTSICQ
jgi:hypothetical protein